MLGTWERRQEVMVWRFGFAVYFAVMVAAPAHPCKVPPPEPRRLGESITAYDARIAKLHQEREEARLKDRQTRGLQGAELIFIARETVSWLAPRPTSRNGRPVLPRLKPVPYPVPSNYRPIAWFRGPRVTDMFKLQRANTSCGPMGIGDTTFGKSGNLYVFFARKGQLSEKTIIDAIALERINDPALAEFVATFRGKSKPPLR